MRPSPIIWKSYTTLLLLLVLFVALPFIKRLPFTEASIFFENWNDFTTTLIRTLLYSFISSIVLVLFGFLGAILLRQIPFFSSTGKGLGILILPVILGNISIAFICKLILGDTDVFSTLVAGGVMSKLGFLLLMQIWQLGFLFVYLFWLHFQSIPSNYQDYATANKFSSFQLVKDIYAPHSKNLWVLLGSLGFVFSLYEESKIHYLFKVSQGTNSELITNWLSRNYQSSILANPAYAKALVFNAGAITATIAILVLIILFAILNFTFKISTVSAFYPFSLKKSFNGILVGKSFGILLLISVIIPLVLIFTKIQFDFSSSILELGFPLFMTLFATVITCTVAILFGISSRLGWQNTLNSFGSRSLIFFVFLFFIMLLPPLIILISGYNWMGILGFRSETMIYLIWIAGHTVLTLPVLGSFVLFNHFQVTSSELNYLRVFKVSKKELIKNTFWLRFKPNYMLLFIISFSLIWNEAILNSLFSDYIPSFASGLKMLITGRGADYKQAFGYLLVSIMLAISAVLIWRYIIEKAQKIKEQ